MKPYSRSRWSHVISLKRLGLHVAYALKVLGSVTVCWALTILVFLF